jgi:hypothetical protein
MRLAVMQPYLFPYLGYFQLMASVDRFVLFDDVHFIKRGWINRNRILLDGGDHLFTVPLQRASQNRLISDTLIVDDYTWKKDLLKTLEQAYRRAPHFAAVFPVVEAAVLNNERSIARFVAHSLNLIVAYIGIPVELVSSSQPYRNCHLKGQDRILDICLKEGASAYHNAIGGRDLYDPARFTTEGIALRFVLPNFRQYEQRAPAFIAGLSIVDVLMWNDVEAVQTMLNEYELA